MIGRNERDLTPRERLPQRSGLRLRAQRWRALGHRTEALGVLVGQHQVVRSHLAGDIDAAPAGLGLPAQSSNGNLVVWRAVSDSELAQIQSTGRKRQISRAYGFGANPAPGSR